MIVNPSYTEKKLSYYLKSFIGLYFKIFIKKFFITYNFFTVNVNICLYILSRYEDQVVGILIYMKRCQYGCFKFRLEYFPVSLFSYLPPMLLEPNHWFLKS